MKRIYVEYFQVPENGKVRDKVLNTRLAVGIVGILLCLIALSVTAYAYFSHTVTSQTETLSSASFDVALSITSPEGAPTVESVAGSYKVYLKKDVPYTVSLQPEGSASTGFCRIAVDGVDAEFHTGQLGKDGGATRSLLTFDVLLSDGGAYLVFTPCWGTSSYFAKAEDPAVAAIYILNGETLSAAVDPEAQTMGKPANIAEDLPVQDETDDTVTSDVSSEKLPADSDAITDDETPSDVLSTESATGSEEIPDSSDLVESSTSSAVMDESSDVSASTVSKASANDADLAADAE